MSGSDSGGYKGGDDKSTTQFDTSVSVSAGGISGGGFPFSSNLHPLVLTAAIAVAVVAGCAALYLLVRR